MAGRPVVQIDMDELAVLMRFKPGKADCAAFFKCSEDTIDKRIREHSDCTFAEFRDQNMVHTRFSLIRKALSEAEKGNTVMIIFCLKNMCGWSDSQKITLDGEVTNNHRQVEAVDLSERVKQIKGAE